KNDKGELVKKKYGPWILRVFKVLARMKSLRGTALDPFGKTQERRHERQLIEDYFNLVDEFADRLSDHNLAVAIELASLPDDIRGFGHIKERNLAQVSMRRRELLQAYRQASTLEKVA